MFFGFYPREGDYPVIYNIFCILWRRGPGGGSPPGPKVRKSTPGTPDRQPVVLVTPRLVLSYSAYRRPVSKFLGGSLAGPLSGALSVAVKHTGKRISSTCYIVLRHDGPCITPGQNEWGTPSPGGHNKTLMFLKIQTSSRKFESSYQFSVWGGGSRNTHLS